MLFLRLKFVGTRKVEGAAGNGSAGGDALYLAHTTLLITRKLGIQSSDQGKARATPYLQSNYSELEAPDQYLRFGEVNLRGVGEILE